MSHSLPHRIRAKMRFALAKLPYTPVRYRLRCSEGDLRIWWSQVMPFLDPEHGFWNFDLYGWDVRELRFLTRYLREGMTFIDVGAYHGLYSVVAAKCVGERGRVVGFEPTPHDRRRAERHLRWNGATNAVIEPYAVSAACGEAEYFVPTRGVRTVAGLRASALQTSASARIRVPTITLDEYCRAHGVDRIDVVKIDVEGAELALLAGASDVLRRLRPLWIIEAIDDVTRAWDYEAAEIIRRVEQHGYRWYEFTADGGATPHTVRAHYPLQSNANYLAVPEERGAPR